MVGVSKKGICHSWYLVSLEVGLLKEYKVRLTFPQFPYESGPFFWDIQSFHLM